MGNTKMNKNELIIRRRRKKRARRLWLFIILLVSILVTLCLKLPYFQISAIIVSGNKNVAKEEIIKLSNIYIGNNIFYINVQQCKQGISRNSYIQGVQIKRQLPNKLVISVAERKAAFYNIQDGKYVIIDSNGIVLEKVDSITERSLTKLEGMDLKQAEIGKVVPSDDPRKIQLIGKITDLILLNNSEYKFETVDIKEVANINIYCGNMCIKLGNDENLGEKLNKALNLLKNVATKDSKGYIDVSYKGNPVFFIEK